MGRLFQLWDRKFHLKNSRIVILPHQLQIAQQLSDTVRGKASTICNVYYSLCISKFQWSWVLFQDILSIQLKSTVKSNTHQTIPTFYYTFLFHVRYVRTWLGLLESKYQTTNLQGENLWIQHFIIWMMNLKKIWFTSIGCAHAQHNGFNFHLQS